MIHTFYRDYEGWFIDLPQYISMGLGSKGNLAMVAGADTMLEILANGDDRITLQIETKDFEGSEGKLTKTGFCPYGENYLFTSEAIKDHKMWLCPVTKFVFGGFYPKNIYIKIVKE
jgi:hypothetical protein